MIDFLIEFPSTSPVDTALLLVTIVYTILAWRVLAAATKRDPSVAQRMSHWQEVFEAAARERRSKSRPSPAE